MSGVTFVKIKPEDDGIRLNRWFLKEYPQFELDDITENLCRELRSDVIEKGCIQFFPGVHDCDGFFIARLKKKA